ncbi:hypothetical protein K8P10_001910 [Leucobacter sp. Psy1]|nr:hypothetical protein K8P10_001910 [Leucobacter sp. Psy1]
MRLSQQTSAVPPVAAARHTTPRLSCMVSLSVLYADPLIVVAGVYLAGVTSQR